MSQKIFKQIGIGLLVTFCVTGKLQAQTDPMYSQYMYNMLGINPAYAGSRKAISLNAFYRKQWVSLPGAPQTTSVSVDGAINDNKVGLGIQLYDDRLGVEKATGFNAMVSTRVHVSEKGVLSGGLSFGMMNYRTDLTQVPNRFTPGDPAFSQNYSKWMATIGAGLYYNTDRFYAGVSVPNILRTRIATLDLITSGIQKANDFHIFITSGVVLDVSDEVKLKPSVLLKAVSGAPVQADLNCNVWLRDVIGLGASYRTGDAIVGMAELQVNPQLRLGYAYDVTTSQLNSFNRGSHELMFRFEFGRNKTIKSTRYF